MFQVQGCSEPDPLLATLEKWAPLPNHLLLFQNGRGGLPGSIIMLWQSSVGHKSLKRLFVDVEAAQQMRLSFHLHVCPQQAGNGGAAAVQHLWQREERVCHRQCHPDPSHSVWDQKTSVCIWSSKSLGFRKWELSQRWEVSWALWTSSVEKRCHHLVLYAPGLRVTWSVPLEYRILRSLSTTASWRPSDPGSKTSTSCFLTLQRLAGTGCFLHKGLQVLKAQF